MKIMEKQKYEEYWKLTLEYTNFWDNEFIKGLKTIIDFIDEHPVEEYSQENYQELQNIYKKKIGNKADPSIRKGINSYVKLGFVNYGLISYHPDAKDYLSAKTERKRRILFSKIVYSNSSFNRSVTNNSDDRQINFLVKTLTELGNLSKKDLGAIMTVDIHDYPDGFIGRDELDSYVSSVDDSGFLERKYNQHSYLWNILGKLEDLTFVNDSLYFKDDAYRLFGESIEYKETRKRDPYLQRLYKNALIDESQGRGTRPKCMVEGLAYPVLIASHIKPFADCDKDDEAFDVNNGFLLSKNIDSLFDLGYITFDDRGHIEAVNDLSRDVRAKIRGLYVNPKFMNNKRREYLKYHRANVFGKRYNPGK